MPFDYAVILPTYNEKASLERGAGNIRRMAAGIGRPYEIIVVDDDSPDGTGAEARRLGLRTIVRKNRRGLASAILEGFRAAEAPNVFVMDADGQHDLARFPQMVEILCSNRADLVVASRYLKEGQMKMDPLRRAVSGGAALIAKPLLGEITDPMSGFFGVKKKPLMTVRRWSLIGFKLLPEIVVRCPGLRVAQVPLQFKERLGGESKMDGREVLNYLHLSARLYLARLGIG
ncbi:Glycosyltransferase AglD [uncultured archaeon]|nr:Glycosyltransferase AglD [uncultured archaeon]